MSGVRTPHSPYDSLAQLVEQLTFNQWVTGSNLVRVIIFAGVAELADAPDLGSGAARRGGSSPFTRIKYKFAGLAQLVEHLICNQRVEGSSPLAGICGSSSAVEHHLAKVGVAGSNPVFRLA